MPPLMEPWGNLETMNLNEVLHVNIIGSPYYQSIQEIDTFEGLVDEIDEKVTCLGSSYLRGMGFLYLRYANHPKYLWDWYFDYMDDEDTVLVATRPKRIIEEGEEGKGEEGAGSRGDGSSHDGREEVDLLSSSKVILDDFGRIIRNPRIDTKPIVSRSRKGL
ncbi:hypothetical protein BJ684DRAFT_21459 [Piptocephalis cylindrospora]|uniref:Pre-mRNA-splicing factor 38 n=1 Tax=Piptocephalis cylindrospora TaxID=1907219 RepID=A0A4P9XZT5_9FUNG|nr:hypothetical protein BJ684DRAFT_21459 [Piptocephalis cylindrospora]|eukprot:RKP11965.1 hypothetical protein BJ684DRAFT_21459 [Piptocephalis cylindrospora]